MGWTRQLRGKFNPYAIGDIFRVMQKGPTQRAFFFGEMRAITA